MASAKAAAAPAAAVKAFLVTRVGDVGFLLARVERANPPGDCGALVERQIAVIRARQRHSHPASLFEQVGQFVGHRQC